MTHLSHMSALDIDQTLHAANVSKDMPLAEAIGEVIRLREVIQDAIDLINTHPITYREHSTNHDYDGLLKLIEDGLQRYFRP